MAVNEKKLAVKHKLDLTLKDVLPMRRRTYFKNHTTTCAQKKLYDEKNNNICNYKNFQTRNQASLVRSSQVKMKRSDSERKISPLRISPSKTPQPQKEEEMGMFVKQTI